MRTPFLTRDRAAGFTLIELLVVIAIIAILVGLLLPVLAVARKHANNAATKAVMHNLMLALDNYKTDTGLYPIRPGGSNKIFDSGSGYNPGFYQTPSVAVGTKAIAATSNDNHLLIKHLLDQRFLDAKKTDVGTDYKLKDKFAIPIVVRFLVMTPVTVGDTSKLTEKPYAWSYGADITNAVNATVGATDPAYTNVGGVNYDKVEIDNIEASPAGSKDDLTTWR